HQLGARRRQQDKLLPCLLGQVVEGEVGLDDGLAATGCELAHDAPIATPVGLVDALDGPGLVGAKLFATHGRPPFGNRITVAATPEPSSSPFLQLRLESTSSLVSGGTRGEVLCTKPAWGGFSSGLGGFSETPSRGLGGVSFLGRPFGLAGARAS